ncbi:MAG: response regulator transcription factor [Clostridia bacterium]|nr:response regulator transcription factor [Clostridia bacterium]
MLKPKILIVEDEINISNFISATLNANNYMSEIAKNGKQAEVMISASVPDLILLDLGLPDMDGTEIIKSVRAWSNVPIIVVSARGLEQEKVEALDLGADDYITKPFGTSELLARIRTALRHSSSKGRTADNKIIVKDLQIDFDKRIITLKGNIIHLTQIEYKIITLLGENLGKVLTYDYILKNVWGPYANSDNQILRVNMANIRRKLEENPAEPVYILTEVGVGYRMVEL